MDEIIRPTHVVPEGRRRELLTDGERLIVQARAIRALVNQLIESGYEHQQVMRLFKQDSDLNRAEARGDRELGVLLYRVCEEGEALLKLTERFRQVIPEPRS
jgi:hypothetical protein